MESVHLEKTPMALIQHALDRSNLHSRTISAARLGLMAGAAFALGAAAMGAVAIGVLAIGRLSIGRAQVRRLEIEELVVRRIGRDRPLS